MGSKVSWIESTIGQQATLQRGFDITKAEQREGKVPVISSGGVASYHDTVAVAGPGVVLGRKGVVGSVYFVQEDYWPHDTSLWVKDFHGNYPRFVYYFFKSVAPQIAKMDVGSANPTLNRNHVHPMPVVWPPLAQQKAIAGVLGALDDKIELNRQMNATLQAMARALFQSWFVDAAASKPKSWSEISIAGLCGINSWTLGKNDELDHIEYVEISEVQRGNIANIQSYQRGDEPNRARRRLRHGDTVLSTVRPDRGAYFLCLYPSPSLIASTGFAVLTPTKVPWSFVHAAMTQPEVFEYLGQHADGGAYPAVRTELIGKMTVPWPNQKGLLESFHSACAPLYERAEHNRLESRTLAELRDALLPKLLSGEVRLKHYDKPTEAWTVRSNAKTKQQLSETV